MLMDMFFDAVPIEAKRRVHFHAFMQEVQAGIATARKDGLDDAIAPVAKGIADSARLLCFDEMQITDIADAMIVGRLFEKLIEAGVTIVTTSNRPPDGLYKDGLNRQLFLPFIDLLNARMVVHELAADADYRQGRLAGERVYFTPGRRRRARSHRHDLGRIDRGRGRSAGPDRQRAERGDTRFSQRGREGDILGALLKTPRPG